jgi:two-component system chemotaxis response regulator CheY
MAGMDGLEVLRQLKALDPDARVVMATADVQSSTRVLAEAGGAAGFVTKPFNADAILGAVDAALTPQGGVA